LSQVIQAKDFNRQFHRAIRAGCKEYQAMAPELLHLGGPLQAGIDTLITRF